VWALTRDAEGALWIGTDAGVQRMNPNGSLRTWTDRDGIAGRQVRALAIGPDGHVWVGTDAGGLSEINPRNGSVRRYESKDGFDRMSASGLVFDHEGRLWVSAVGAVFRGTSGPGPTRFAQQAVPGSDNAEIFFQASVDQDGAVWIT